MARFYYIAVIVCCMQLSLLKTSRAQGDISYPRDPYDYDLGYDYYRVRNRNRNDYVITHHQSDKLQLVTGKCNDMKKNNSLKFSNVGLRRIGEDFIDSPYINCVSLDNNDIEEISPNAFRRLPNLMFLDLSGNRLSAETLYPLNVSNSLQTLVLDNMNTQRSCNIARITQSFPSVKNLYLRKNNFDSCPPQNFGTSGLVHLYLSDNSIGRSDMNFLQNFPPNMTHVYLENNGIRKIGDNSLSHFVHVALDGNRIECICNGYCYVSSQALSLSGATSLQYLSVSNNLITHINPTAFKDTKNLTYLNVSGNKIERIAQGTFDMVPLLRNLSLRHNLLTEMPNFCALVNLQYLDLHGNNITTIPAYSICISPSLKVLLLGQNGIKSIEAGVFTNATNLEVLDLSYNSLSHLSQDWITLDILRSLDLRGNEFKNFYDLSVVGLNSLADLYLQENEIESLNTLDLAVLPKNCSIHLNSKYPACTAL